MVEALLCTVLDSWTSKIFSFLELSKYTLSHRGTHYNESSRIPLNEADTIRTNWRIYVVNVAL